MTTYYTRTIELWLEKLETKAAMYQLVPGYVVESKNHVNVGQGFGLNGTEFDVKCPPASAMAQVFDTRENAEKYGCDYCLVDGNGKPVTMKITPAAEFFQREANLTRGLLLCVQGSEKGGER